MKNQAAVTLRRLGGKVTSEAKAAAVRKNGKLGGRPATRMMEIIRWVEDYSAPGGSLVLRSISGEPRKVSLGGARTVRGWMRANGYSDAQIRQVTCETVSDESYHGIFTHDSGEAYRIVDGNA